VARETPTGAEEHGNEEESSVQSVEEPEQEAETLGEDPDCHICDWNRGGSRSRHIESGRSWRMEE